MGRVSFPTDALRGQETALCLFAAAFGGLNDAQFLRDAGLRATCVDIDRAKLWDMEFNYPTSWEFFPADVFEFCERTDRTWDVVTVDCPTGLFQKCAERLPLFCSMAKSAVILGSGTGHAEAPKGWRIEGVQQRSNFKGGVYWIDLRRMA